MRVFSLLVLFIVLAQAALTAGASPASPEDNLRALDAALLGGDVSQARSIYQDSLRGAFAAQDPALDARIAAQLANDSAPLRIAPIEMGIARAHNVQLASLPNFRLPGDVSASERYFETEIIGEPFTVSADGTMAVPTGPGIGVTVLEDAIRKLSLRTKEYRPAR